MGCHCPPGPSPVRRRRCVAPALTRDCPQLSRRPAMAKVAEHQATAGYVFSPSKRDVFQPRGVLPSSSTLDRVRSRSPRMTRRSPPQHVREPKLMTQDPGRSTGRTVGQNDVRVVGQVSGIGESPISDPSGTACTPDQETSDEDNNAIHVGGVVSGFLLRPKSKPG